MRFFSPKYLVYALLFLVVVFGMTKILPHQFEIDPVVVLFIMIAITTIVLILILPEVWSQIQFPSFKKVFRPFILIWESIGSDSTGKTSKRTRTILKRKESHDGGLHDTYKETLILLKKGYSIEEIASQRNLTPSAINSHVKKLRSHNKLDDITIETEADTGSSDRIDLHDWQEELIDQHLEFYRSLDTGEREPETEEQQHFVDVLRGEAEPKTEHEFAYIRYKKKMENSR